jgi:hypothetical protein
MVASIGARVLTRQGTLEKTHEGESIANADDAQKREKAEVAILPKGYI